MWWSDLFINMNPTDFFNFSFLPKYGTAFVRGIRIYPVAGRGVRAAGHSPGIGAGPHAPEPEKAGALALRGLHRRVPLHPHAGAAVHHLLRPVLRHLPAPADPLRLRGYQPLHPRRGGAGP